MPFREAIKEIESSHHTGVTEPTGRRVTYRNGGAAEAIACQTVLRMEKEGVEEGTASPGWLQLSVDGSFIQLVNGEWREVKGVAVGEIKHLGEQAEVVKTEHISYFTRSYKAREFERFALAELQHRGVDQAQLVVAINDGAEWIQGFIDYHCPEAIRILDFAHAMGYVCDAGKAVWGEGSEAYKQWIGRTAHQLKHSPPQRTLADLRLLLPKARSDEQAEVLDRALRYLGKRQEMMDYPYFRKRGYPIGSGSVESGHKLVVQSRLKGAGMRWAEHHVDPLLALRDLICNDRWSEGWQDIVAHHWQQQHQKRRQRLLANQPPPTQPLSFASLETAGLLPELPPPDVTQAEAPKSKRPAKDHPWRRGIWPTKEAWRWN